MIRGTTPTIIFDFCKCVALELADKILVTFKQGDKVLFDKEVDLAEQVKDDKVYLTLTQEETLLMKVGTFVQYQMRLLINGSSFSTPIYKDVVLDTLNTTIMVTDEVDPTPPSISGEGDFDIPNSQRICSCVKTKTNEVCATVGNIGYIKGDDGISPTITVKEASTGVYILTITDVNGTFDTPNLAAEEGLKDVIQKTEKGSPNGVATLDDTGRVPATQLPSYVDDVLEFDTRASFPKQGEDGKIYIAKDTNLQYRWSGSEYVEISSSLALGETPQTAYAGDKGKKNADDIAELKNNAEALETKLDGIKGIYRFSESSVSSSFSGTTELYKEDLISDGTPREGETVLFPDNKSNVMFVGTISHVNDETYTIDNIKYINDSLKASGEWVMGVTANFPEMYNYNGGTWLCLTRDITTSPEKGKDWFCISEPAPVTSVNGSTGEVEITAESLSLATVATSGDYNDLSNTPDLSEVGKVKSVNGKTGDVEITSEDLGLADVATSGDYTDLINTPSIPQVPEWALNETKPSYTKEEVGLGNVQNVDTTNASNITSGKLSVERLDTNTANGVLKLDEQGKVPTAQLPSYVDDVEEYASRLLFPKQGESGKIYLDTETNLTYRWSGSEYVEISPSIALGETPSTAYAGNKGKANADAISALQTRVGDVEKKNAEQDTALGEKYSEDNPPPYPVTSVNQKTGNVTITASELGTARPVYYKLNGGAMTDVGGIGKSYTLAKSNLTPLDPQPIVGDTVVFNTNTKVYIGTITTAQTSAVVAEVKLEIGGQDSGETETGVITVNGRNGAVTLTKSDVNLDLVDNIRQYSADNPPPYPVTSVNGETGEVSITALSLGLSDVATSGSYEDLTNTPSIPAVPAWALEETKPTYIWTEIGEKPEFAKVATSGKYADLLELPDLESLVKVSSVNGKDGEVVLAKEDIGLGLVDNVLQYSERNQPPYPVVSVNEKTGAVVISADDLSLSEVAKTGLYSDIIDTPQLGLLSSKDTITNADISLTANIEQSKIKGLETALASKANTEDLADIATSGSYLDLKNAPSFALVATSGKYTDLIEKPDIPTYTEATQVLSGLMSATDKKRLDDIYLLVGEETGDADEFVNTIREVLQTFENFPEGSDIASLLASKADKTALASKADKTDIKVTSVASRTGDIVLTKADVGLSLVDNVKQYSAENEPPYPVVSVNSKTGKVTITAEDLSLGAVATSNSYNDLDDLPDLTSLCKVKSVNGKTGEVTITAKDLSLATVATSGEYSDLSGTPSIPYVYEWALSETKPTYSKSEVGLGSVDNVKQYSATNPPPYPVTSVNGKTGAVTIDTYTKPTGGIPATELASAVQTSLSNADNAVQKSGDTMTGTLTVGSASIQTNGYITGTWLATKSATNLNEKATKIAVIGVTGSKANYIYFRTPEEVLSGTKASSTQYGSVKVYVDSDGYLCIDT